MRCRFIIATMLLCGFRLLAAADEITLGLRPVPPYVTVGSDGRVAGLEYEIIAAAFAAAGHSVKVQVLPLARLVQSFKAGSLMAAAPILPATNSGGILSDVYLAYHNVVMTLKASGPVVRGYADLRGLRIAAFQTATKALGPEFAATVAGNATYEEVATQITQIRMLFSGRIDAAIGDSRILEHYIHDPEAKVDSAVEVTEYLLFAPTEYRVAFREPRLAREFNAGLALIRKNGVYAAIVAKFRP